MATEEEKEKEEPLEFDDVEEDDALLDDIDKPEKDTIDDDIEEVEPDPFIIKWNDIEYNMRPIFPLTGKIWMELEKRGVIPFYLTEVAMHRGVPSKTISFCYVILRRAGVPVKHDDIKNLPMSLVNGIMTRILLAAKKAGEEEAEEKPDYPFSN